MNGTSNENQTHLCRFACLACQPPEAPLTELVGDFSLESE